MLQQRISKDSEHFDEVSVDISKLNISSGNTLPKDYSVDDLSSLAKEDSNLEKDDSLGNITNKKEIEEKRMQRMNDTSDTKSKDITKILVESSSNGTIATPTTLNDNKVSSQKEDLSSDSDDSSEEAYKKKMLDNSSGHDDKNGNYVFVKGELFNNRYEIINYLGKGTYGVVTKAYDIVNGVNVALKIIKNSSAFTKQAQIEIKILNKLNRFDSSGIFKTVKLLDTFVFKNHVCLVFEYLSISLYELISYNSFRGLSLSVVRKIAHQLFLSLAFLRSSNIHTIHCDLKPENIMLIKRNHTALKLIDFGSACDNNSKKYKYVQSRFYRAPEVVYGMDYSYPADMWSVGCILVELLTGKPLFSGSTETEQVVKYINVLGMPPLYMIKKCPKVRKLFIPTPSGDYQLHQVLKKSVCHIDLQRIIFDCKYTHPINTPGVFTKFYELISNILVYSPDFRMTPAMALKHSFFKVKIEDSAGNVFPPLSFDYQSELKRIDDLAKQSNE